MNDFMDFIKFGWDEAKMFHKSLKHLGMDCFFNPYERVFFLTATFAFPLGNILGGTQPVLLVLFITFALIALGIIAHQTHYQVSSEDEKVGVTIHYIVSLLCWYIVLGMLFLAIPTFFVGASLEF